MLATDISKTVILALSFKSGTERPTRQDKAQ